MPEHNLGGPWSQIEQDEPSKTQEKNQVTTNMTDQLYTRHIRSEQELASAIQHLRSPSLGKVILLTGPSGAGKSFLASKAAAVTRGSVQLSTDSFSALDTVVTNSGDLSPKYLLDGPRLVTRLTQASEDWHITKVFVEGVSPNMFDCLTSMNAVIRIDPELNYYKTVMFAKARDMGDSMPLHWLVGNIKMAASSEQDYAALLRAWWTPTEPAIRSYNSYFGMHANQVTETWFYAPSLPQQGEFLQGWHGNTKVFRNEISVIRGSYRFLSNKMDKQDRLTLMLRHDGLNQTFGLWTDTLGTTVYDAMSKREVSKRLPAAQVVTGRNTPNLSIKAYNALIQQLPTTTLLQLSLNPASFELDADVRYMFEAIDGYVHRPKAS